MKMDESEVNTESEITNQIVKTLHKEHVNDVKSFPSLHGERLETSVGQVCSKVQTSGTCIQNIVRNWKQSVPGTQGIFKITSLLLTNKMMKFAMKLKLNINRIRKS
jgi:hypothetical protein